MPRDLRAYLYDIAEACDLVADFTDGKSAGDYSADPLVRSAVERQLEIVGESMDPIAANRPSRKERSGSLGARSAARA